MVVVFTACLMFSQNQRAKETAQAVENNTVNLQPSADIEVVEQRVESVALASLSSLALPEPEAVEETEECPEAKRLANWKANFPYQPTTDPDVVITEEMLANYGSGDPTVIHNHCYLRLFFEDESRFTAQFEQLYHILEEHRRGDNPMATGNIFECLRRYHEDRKRDPEEIARSAYDHRENRRSTYGELVEDAKEMIVGLLQSEREWPDRKFMPEDEAIALRDRILNEIQGVDKLPIGTKNHFVINLDYADELEPRDSPLVIRPGWQADYEKNTRQEAP